MDQPDSPPTEKRDLVIAAAEAEFRENGYAAASMDRVTARAGVSKRTVYRYFESKEALFHAIVANLWGRFADSLDLHYEKGRDIRDQLTDLARAEGDLLSSEDTMMMVRMVMSEVLRRPELAETMQDKIDFRASFVDMLQQASDDGQLRVEDPALAADEFLALIKAKAFWPVVMGEPVISRTEMDRIIASSVEMMMCRYGIGDNGRA